MSIADSYPLQHTATHCNTLQHTATHCNTLQHTATHLSIADSYPLQHTATHCNTGAPQCSFSVGPFAAEMVGAPGVLGTAVGGSVPLKNGKCTFQRRLALVSPLVNASSLSIPNLGKHGWNTRAAGGGRVRHDSFLCMIWRILYV